MSLLDLSKFYLCYTISIAEIKPIVNTKPSARSYTPEFPGKFPGNQTTELEFLRRIERFSPLNQVSSPGESEHLKGLLIYSPGNRISNRYTIPMLYISKVLYRKTVANTGFITSLLVFTRCC